MKKLVAISILTLLLSACTPKTVTNSEELPVDSSPSETVTEEPQSEPGDSEEPTEDVEVEVELTDDMEVLAESSTDEGSVQYAQAEYTKDRGALNDSGPKVLFFHANWCPTCNAWRNRVQANLGNFPDGTKIVEVNYDTEKDLKKTYDVKYQTSVVVLDANGSVVSNTVNPSDKQLIEAINQSL